MANCSRLYVVEKLLPIFRRRFTQILKMIKNSQDIMRNLDLLKNIKKKQRERDYSFLLEVKNIQILL